MRRIPSSPKSFQVIVCNFLQVILLRNSATWIGFWASQTFYLNFSEFGLRSSTCEFLHMVVSSIHCFIWIFFSASNINSLPKTCKCCMWLCAKTGTVKMFSTFPLSLPSFIKPSYTPAINTSHTFERRVNYTLVCRLFSRNWRNSHQRQQRQTKQALSRNWPKPLEQKRC